MTYKLKNLFNESSSPAEYARGHLHRMSEILRTLDDAVLGRIIERVDRASREGRSIFVIANGGSAAVASHMVNDLGPNSYVEGKPTFRVFSLADNVESVTAIANDLEYNEIFVHQLRVLLQPGDVVIAMSVSGNSENIIRAVEYATDNGADVIGLCGFDGGRLASRSTLSLHAESTPDEYGPVEDVFSVVNHLVSGYLTMLRGRYLHH